MVDRAMHETIRSVLLDERAERRIRLRDTQAEIGSIEHIVDIPYLPDLGSPEIGIAEYGMPLAQDISVPEPGIRLPPMDKIRRNIRLETIRSTGPVCIIHSRPLVINDIRVGYCKRNGRTGVIVPALIAGDIRGRNRVPAITGRKVRQEPARGECQKDGK